MHDGHRSSAAELRDAADVARSDDSRARARDVRELAVAQAGGEATKNMIRTAPLWGVRTRDRLMHDGGSSSAPTNSGAQSFTFNEAILRHAGQATSSRTAYQALSTVEKMQLIHFLKSL